MLIFYEVDFKQFRNLRHLFLCFEAVTRLKINLGKSKDITVGDINNVEELAAIVGCRVAQLLMTYLGFFRSTVKSIYIWNSIVEMVKKADGLEVLCTSQRKASYSCKVHFVESFYLFLIIVSYSYGCGKKIRKDSMVGWSQIESCTV